MTDHMYRNFPDQIKAIQTNSQMDADFREICDDYEEICAWVALQDRSEPRPSKEYEHARELIRDLEDEITKALKDAGL